MTVYVVANKKKKLTKVGFTDDLTSFLKKLQQDDKVWVLIQKETYAAKKNAMIRVKQLKNKLK